MEKLKLVLEQGTLRQVKSSELLKEIQNFKGEALNTKKNEIKKVQSNLLKGFSCWEFTPYDPEILGVERIRQFSRNPFTIVKDVYKYIKQL